MFDKVAILGVGLLGASFSLAMKQHGLCGQVSGFGRNQENLRQAKERGIIDVVADDAVAVCTDADLILLAAPVGAFPDLVRVAHPSFRKGAIVTDVGSVKGSLVRELEDLLPAGVHFVGSHPIAGSDRSGMEHADAALFRNALCVVTPTDRTDAEALGRITDLWKMLGARVTTMDPAEHDRVYAAVSHLPHLVAFALMNAVSQIDKNSFSFCGQGFRDMTRIAASSPEIWTDIALRNRANLRDMLAVFRQNLDRMDADLKAADAEGLKDMFRHARTLRNKLGQD